MNSNPSKNEIDSVREALTQFNDKCVGSDGHTPLNIVEYDGDGNVLMTKRAPGKSFAGTWENSGGGAQAGETSLQAIRRELFEETGIQAEESEFELLETGQDSIAFYDYYCLRRKTPLDQIVLQPGETVDVKWVSLDEVYGMIERKEICYVISQQFLRQAPMLRKKQTAQD